MRVVLRNGQRVPPVEFADAVEKWARDRGTHAKLVWVPWSGHWQVRIQAQSNNPITRLLSREDSEEVVDLLVPGKIRRPNGSHMPGLVGVELDQLGLQSILDTLNESYRGGRYRDAAHMTDEVRKRNERLREHQKQSARDDARHRFAEDYSQAMGHPVVPGVDLPVASEKDAATTED